MFPWNFGTCSVKGEPSEDTKVFYGNRKRNTSEKIIELPDCYQLLFSRWMWSSIARQHLFLLFLESTRKYLGCDSMLFAVTLEEWKEMEGKRFVSTAGLHTCLQSGSWHVVLTLLERDWGWLFQREWSELFGCLAQTRSFWSFYHMGIVFPMKHLLITNFSGVRNRCVLSFKGNN